jgi:hypothetical protein
MAKMRLSMKASYAGGSFAVMLILILCESARSQSGLDLAVTNLVFDSAAGAAQFDLDNRSAKMATGWSLDVQTIFSNGSSSRFRRNEDWLQSLVLASFTGAADMLVGGPIAAGQTKHMTILADKSEGLVVSQVEVSVLGVIFDDGTAVSLGDSLELRRMLDARQVESEEISHWVPYLTEVKSSGSGVEGLKNVTKRFGNDAAAPAYSDQDKQRMTLSARDSVKSSIIQTIQHAEKAKENANPIIEPMIRYLQMRAQFARQHSQNFRVQEVKQ